MAKINNITLTSITHIETVERHDYKPVRPGLGFYQNLASQSPTVTLEGTLTGSAKSTREGLRALARSGLAAYVDLDDREEGLVGYARVYEFRARSLKAGYLWRYAIGLQFIPAMGTTMIQTPEAWLHDLDYQATLRMFDPQQSRHNLTWSVNRLEAAWSFYIDNDKSSGQTVIVESHVGDDLSQLQLYGWKAGDWVLIGDWGGADAWGATKAFTDADSVAHNFVLNRGVLGEVVAGIGTISQAPGLNRRVIFSVSGMAAQGGTDVSTDIGGDQLLVKALAIHTQRETIRPYPVVTVMDGSVDYGRA